MGRPTKCTAARRKAILQALRDGNTRTAAAESVGVPRARLWQWLIDNETFRDEVVAAEAEAEARCVGILSKAVRDGDTQSARWWLERRRSDDWGRRERIDVYEYQQVRREAERIAAELKIPVDQVLRESGVSLPISAN